jgi:hypothetical protein
MDISVIKELKEFEKEQESLLEKEKSRFLKSLEEQNNKLIEKNKEELDKITSKKELLIEKAQEEAKQQAVDSINRFKEKISLLESSKSKISQTTEIILNEFIKNV